MQYYQGKRWTYEGKKWQCQGICTKIASEEKKAREDSMQEMTVSKNTWKNVETKTFKSSLIYAIKLELMQKLGQERLELPTDDSKTCIKKKDNFFFNFVILPTYKKGVWIWISNITLDKNLVAWIFLFVPEIRVIESKL